MNNELSLNFPDMGQWKTFHFHQIMDDVTTIGLPQDGHFLGLYFNLANQYKYTIHNLKSGTLYRGQYNFAYVPQHGAELSLLKGENSSFCIRFTQAIIEKIADDFPILKEFLKCVRLNTPAILANFNMLTVPDMLDAITEIQENRHGFTGELKVVSDHSKIIGLLFSTLKNIQHQAKARIPKIEVEKIGKAYDYLIKNCHKHLSVELLADWVDMDKRRMEKCFKILYCQTVYHFHIDARLKKAFLLLRDTTMAASEIGIAVGYKNANRFSEAFKKKYSLSPIQFRKNDV